MLRTRVGRLVVCCSVLVGAFQAHAEETLIPNKDVAPVAIHNEISSREWTYDFYGESYDAVQYDGVVSQARLRALYPITSKLFGYAGLNWSADMTTDANGLRYGDDFVSPTAGVLFKPWSFLGAFAEYRRLLRTVNNELPSSEDDPRYGIYGYYLYEFPVVLRPHLEFYGESVALSRFTSKPVSTAWLKLGSEQVIVPSLSVTPYVEMFVRESPALFLGFDDQSLRAGGKIKWRWNRFAVQLLTYRRFHSDQTPLGWESLLVLSADGVINPWN